MLYIDRGSSPAITRIQYQPHSTKRPTPRITRLLIPGNVALHPTGPAVSTHPPTVHQRVIRPSVAEGPTPPHSHPGVAVSFLCRCHGYSPCPFRGRGAVGCVVFPQTPFGPVGGWRGCSHYFILLPGFSYFGFPVYDY